jgi:hypothetical protein
MEETTEQKDFIDRRVAEVDRRGTDMEQRLGYRRAADKVNYYTQQGVLAEKILNLEKNPNDHSFSTATLTMAQVGAVAVVIGTLMLTIFVTWNGISRSIDSNDVALDGYKEKVAIEFARSAEIHADLKAADAYLKDELAKINVEIYNRLPLKKR